MFKHGTDRSWAGRLLRAMAAPGLLVAIALATDARTATAQAAADGKAVYNRTCAACHQVSGEGVEGTFPPLVKSEWVTGDKGRLIRVIMHGLTGPITVAGEAYSSTMPPWGSLKDAEIAAVSTYIRTTWGNKASAVTAAEVTSVRNATTGRTKPWTAKELVAATVKEK